MKFITFLLLIISTAAFSIIPETIPPGRWQCLAFDSLHHSYSGLGFNTHEAMFAANKACRKKSTARTSCKTAQSFCEQGPLSLIENRCMVGDSNGRTWNATGLNACKTAMKLCTQWQFLHGKTTQCSVKHR